MTRTGALCLLVLISVLGSWFIGLLAASGGSLKGTVQFAGGAVERKKVPVTVDQFLCGKEKDSEEIMLSPQRGLRNAVAWLELPPEAKRTAPSAPVQIDQIQCVYTPRVVVVSAGGTVEFLNSDRLLHNIHSSSTINPRFNRTQPKDRTIPIAFAKPEIIRIDCDLHPWMRAWVVVADHPFYAVTDDQGQFTLENVAPGRYALHVWHERLGTVRSDVDVAGGVTTVTVEMSAK